MRTRAMRNDMADIVNSATVALDANCAQRTPRDARSIAPKSGPAFLCVNSVTSILKAPIFTKLM